VTPALFKKFPDAKTTASADLIEIISLIRSIGLFNSKARYIHNSAKQIMDKYNGKVPSTMDELIKLSGVARKTANVVLGVGYSINEGIAVDTHVLRSARILGLTEQKTPEKIETDLMKIYPQQDWEQISTLLIHHGREICVARKPKCELCPLQKICTKGTLTLKKKP
jgi:endonuclease-3